MNTQKRRIKNTRKAIDRIEETMLEYRKVKLDNGYVCTIGELVEVNEMTREDYLPLFNLAIGESTTLNWMTMPTVTRVL